MKSAKEYIFGIFQRITKSNPTHSSYFSPEWHLHLWIGNYPPSHGACSHLVTLGHLRWCRNPDCKAWTLTAASHLRGGKSHSIKDIRPSQNLGHISLKLTLPISDQKNVYPISTCNKTYYFVVIDLVIRLRK